MNVEFVGSNFQICLSINRNELHTSIRNLHKSHKCCFWLCVVLFVLFRGILFDGVFRKEDVFAHTLLTSVVSCIPLIGSSWKTPSDLQIVVPRFR